MRQNALLRFALIGLTLAACGDDASDDGVPESETCGLYGEIDVGEGPQALGGEDTTACAWTFSSDTGVTITFLVLEGPTVLLKVPDVAEGGVGTFAAGVEMNVDDVPFQGQCTAEITEHSEVGPGEFGTDYQLRGEVTCAAPLESADGETVTVSSMSFASYATWTD